MCSDPESIYRRGAAQRADRDLDAAVETLGAVVGDPDLVGRDPWWFAASRALAGIAMELDDLDGAEWHLRSLGLTHITVSLTSALRARRWLLLGEHDNAAIEIFVALEQLALDPSDDVGSLMNGAIVLAHCAEVAVDLGYGEEAATAVDEARGRISQTELRDPVLEGKLAIAGAGAARLSSDFDRAAACLAAVDTEGDLDFAVRVLRERGHLAWAAGGHIAAQVDYGQAIALCESGSFVSLGRRIAAERETGPVQPRRDLNGWIEERSRRAMESVRPYAVVVRLVADSDARRYTGLEDRVIELLADAPGLGHVDGIGTDEEVWELYLDGSDPNALWAAVRPLVDAVRPAPGSEVTLRCKRQTKTLSLS